MIGTYAIFGNELFFSESLIKHNFIGMDYPIENWLQKDDSFFIPLATSAILAPAWHDSSNGETLPTNHDFPRTCGLTVFPNRHIHELAVKNNKLIWRSVPWGPGTIYVSSVYEDFEKALYAALKVTGDLRKAVKLASEGSAVTSNNHIFTDISTVAYATHMKDPGLIRTMPRSELIAIVNNQLELNKMLEKEDD